MESKNRSDIRGRERDEAERWGEREKAWRWEVSYRERKKELQKRKKRYKNGNKY